MTVPNNKVKRLVVSRFDRSDMTLSEEFAPTLATDAGLTLAGKRTLDDFYVTGATIAGRQDVRDQRGLQHAADDRPRRRARWSRRAPSPASRGRRASRSKGDELYILGESGTVWVVGR